MFLRRLSSSAARREAAVSGSWDCVSPGLAADEGDRGCFWPGYGAGLKAIGEVLVVGEV